MPHKDLAAALAQLARQVDVLRRDVHALLGPSSSEGDVAGLTFAMLDADASLTPAVARALAAHAVRPESRA
jgi:hypothetical protein